MSRPRTQKIKLNARGRLSALAEEMDSWARPLGDLELLRNGVRELITILQMMDDAKLVQSVNHVLRKSDDHD